MKTILKQSGICIILFLAVMLMQSLNIAGCNKLWAACASSISKNYTTGDVAAFGKKAIQTMKGTSAVIASAVVFNEKNGYGEPMDETVSGVVSSVYAVAGGSVTAVGEDEKYGKYVRISHGKESESMYGHCKEIYVRPLERVKKGQVIADYDTANEDEFYYTLSRFK